MMTDEFNEFQQAEESWLEDFSLFMAIKENMGGNAWNEWPKELRKRKKLLWRSFLSFMRMRSSTTSSGSFYFSVNGSHLHTYVNDLGIKIIGDIPYLSPMILPMYGQIRSYSFSMLMVNLEFVAGVPPDYFSKHRSTLGKSALQMGFSPPDQIMPGGLPAFKSTLSLYDFIRLDHFRGFAGYWEIPAGMPTAEKGRWVKGPGADFLSKVSKRSRKSSDYC